MKYYTAYTMFIILIKVGFMIMALAHIYMMLKGKQNSPIDHKIVYWKERFEFIFTALMAILLVYLFRPSQRASALVLDKETYFLLYLFGFVLLITADWRHFL